jgi:hypothetical protein
MMMPSVHLRRLSLLRIHSARGRYFDGGGATEIEVLLLGIDMVFYPKTNANDDVRVSRKGEIL